MRQSKQMINKRYNDKKKQEKINEKLILEEGELFKIIKDNEKYYITDRGRVFSTISCKFLKPNLGKNGYFWVCLSNRKKLYIHRLLALHFIENIDNKPFIDHIDRNKQNNKLENLRWVSCEENNINRYNYRSDILETDKILRRRAIKNSNYEKRNGLTYRKRGTGSLFFKKEANAWIAKIVVNKKIFKKQSKKKEVCEKWLLEINR